MRELDPKLAQHNLNIKPDSKPMKQLQQKFKQEMQEAIEAEIKKLKACRFIRLEQHPDWLSNIVPVMKKNENVKNYIDFRNLNDAFLKYEFALLVTDVMINKTCDF